MSACAKRLFDSASAWRNSFAPDWRERMAGADGAVGLPIHLLRWKALSTMEN